MNSFGIPSPTDPAIFHKINDWQLSTDHTLEGTYQDYILTTARLRNTTTGHDEDFCLEIPVRNFDAQVGIAEVAHDTHIRWSRLMGDRWVEPDLSKYQWMTLIETSQGNARRRVFLLLDALSPEMQTHYHQMSKYLAPTLGHLFPPDTPTSPKKLDKAW